MEERLDTPNDRHLFLPEMTVQAMRDSRYRHPANAIAELIDNSIDAESDRIEVLIQERQERARQRQVWRVNKLAVLDNGHGMSSETLVQALRFGGRQATGATRRIGKYGMGLPTSSVSQCRRLDVWTWESNIGEAAHSFIDVDEIEQGTQLFVPDPEFGPPPSDWLQLASPGSINSRSGTLVVWSRPDRIRQRAETIFNQLEDEIGRIYRHFISDGDVSMRMASFRMSEQMASSLVTPRADRIVRPNDPLYLTAGSSAPLSHGVPDPMFQEYSRQEYPVTVGGREEVIEVVYSIAKSEILGEYRGDLPGNRPYGQHARKNMGISVVRENREISLENYFDRTGGGGSIPENRWWGCEVLFSSGCDDLFGVDHNKQLVSHFASAMKYLDESDGETLQLILDLGEDEDDVIYKVAGDIRNNTRAMMREIRRMFGRRPKRVQTPDGEPTTTEGKAEDIVQEATREAMEAGGIEETQTDKDRNEQTPDEKIKEVTAIYEAEGFDQEEAQKVAADLVRLGKWYNIMHTPLDGYQMFSFTNGGGVLTMKLNIQHPVYEFIQSIGEDSDGDESSERIAVGILAMLLSWGRMENDIERNEVRLEVQERARTWGRMVNYVLTHIDEGGETSGQ